MQNSSKYVKQSVMQYRPTIGLEIHVELKTESKMFCSCPNDPDEKEPNVNICPVCMGHPGTLPVINKKAVEYTIKAALALNCQIPENSHFDRKSYFYPDLPKGYQISQYKEPLSERGFLEVNSKKIRITRIHLEEDTGKLIHTKGADYSLIDFNRAGRPLMELVTEPEITSAQEARKFAEELRLILRYLNISDADMEKGQMRCEVNISLAPKDEKKLGTKVEIKNLNSFRSVEKGIEYEIKRQTEILERGEKVVQETRGWDDAKGKTFSQRTKEEAHDYRYFPEPDLPPLHISGNLEVGFDDSEVINLETINAELVELPQAHRKRFLEQFKLPKNDIEILVGSKQLADYFEAVISELRSWIKARNDIPERAVDKLIKLTANYILTELQKLFSQSKSDITKCKITPENFAEFITLIYSGEISSSGAQTVLAAMFATGADPSHIIEEKKLKQVSNKEELQEIVKDIIENNPKPVADYKNGNEKSLQFLIGQVMAKTKGRANPQVAAEILKEKIG